MPVSAAALAAILVWPVHGQVRSRPVLPAPAALLPVITPVLSAPGATPALPNPSLPTVSALAAVPSAAPRLAPIVERHGAGLLVVDLKDSTQLYQEIGNRRAHAVTDAVMEFAARTAAELGGVVARRLGDGLLIAFPTPADAAAARERVRARLPAARARLGRPGLRLHLAASGGRVVEDRSGGGFDVYGQAVERALAQASGAAERAEPAPQADPAARAEPAPPAEGEDGWVQAELSQSRMETRATLFTDLKDWPARYETDGRRRAFATVKVFHAFVAAVVRRHGGTLVKTSGEAVMASFLSPAAAVRAAAELQNLSGELRRAAPLGEGLELRVGVSYGRALRQDSLEGTDFFGNTVNAAARLMRRADGGGVLLSARLFADPDAKRLLDAGRSEKTALALKGFQVPVEVYRFDAASLETGPAPGLTAGLRALGRAVLALLPRPG